VIRCIRAQIAVHSPAPYAPHHIPPGTRVKARVSGRVGVVQPYRPNLMGTFSVAWLDGSQLWEVVTADDVAVVASAGSGAA